MRVRRPAPHGTGTVAHHELAGTLAALAGRGMPGLVGQRGELGGYLGRLERIDPDTLTRDEALAYWVNLYNAGALLLAGDAWQSGAGTVLRVPGAFDRRHLRVAGERLSLNDVEHGKIRRFRDPRIHGALVCGSVSCPTLRSEPFTGDGLAAQLDDQMRAFLAGGGAEVDRDAGVLRLSRIFLWFGGDFVRPHRMPTWLPARRSAVAAAVAAWLPAAGREWLDRAEPRIEFQRYDWGLSCAIA